MATGGLFHRWTPAFPPGVRPYILTPGPYSYGPILLWLYVPYIGTAFMVMLLVTAYRATAYIDFALIAMAYIVTVYIVTACVNMASIDTAPCSYGLNR